MYLAAPPHPLEACAEMPDQAPFSQSDLLLLAHRADVLSPVLRWLMHDMRNPVQALCMLTELAADPKERGAEVNLADALSEFCRRIGGDLGLLERLLRPLPEAPSPGPISIADSVRFVAELVGKQHRATSLDVSAVLEAPLPAALGSQEHLDLALLGLVLNSLEMQGKRAGWVRLAAAADDTTVRLQVEDDAPRASPTTTDQLPAGPPVALAGVSGSSLRVLVARTLVRRWGGDLLAGDALEGNRFDLILQLWPRTASR